MKPGRMKSSMSCWRFLRRTMRSSKVNSPWLTALPNLVRDKTRPINWPMAMRLRRGAALTSRRVGGFLIGTETFGQQSREARQIEQVESIVLAGEHRDRGALECVDMIPGLFEGHRFVLRDGGESQLDQKAQTPDQLVFVLDASRPFLISHGVPVPDADVAEARRIGTIAYSHGACRIRRGRAGRALC